MKSLKNIFLLFLVFIVLAFNLKADSPLDDCGYFSGALSTRDACSGSGGTITFSGSANIYDNPDTALATCTVSTPQWVLDGTQTCQTADCTAIPGNTKSASITYNLAPASASLSSDPSTSDTDITVSADTTLADYKYDVVTFNYAGEGKTATFDPSSDDKDLTIHQIASAWKVRFAVDEDIRIGSIASATYSSPFELITTTTPKNIQIEAVNFKEGSTIDLQASSSISMETFSVGRGGSSVTLSAPTITINSLTVSNSGSGIATIRLKADTINLGTLDMGQGAIVIVEPYTAGGNVTYKGNSITASSSSTMRLSSGDYYTNSLNIPGTSSASSIIAMDASSLVNLYINGNFAPGNNPGINSDGNSGNFGSLPATTMRIFINGNFSTGGGGTTLNAVIYVERDATLGNPTYIRGALSAKHSISIGEGSKIYYDSSISDEIYASCIDPIEATSQDICYDTIQYDGMFCMNFGMFQGGINCKQTIPLRNVSGEELTNVDAYINTSGFSGGFLSDCGVDGVSSNCEETSAIDMGPFSMFSSSIAYDLPDFDDNETHSIYEKALMSMSIFSGTNLYATYMKDGVYYVSQIEACGSSGGTEGQTGDFNVVHTAYYGDGITGTTNIPTQIVSKSDNFKILAYETGTTTLKDVNTTVFYEVVDGSSSGDCATMSLLDSSPIMKIFLNTNTVEFSEDFNQTAAKKAYLRIWWNMDFDDKLLQLEEVSPGMYKLPNFPNYAAGQQCGAGFVIPSGNSDQVVTWCGNNGGGQGNNGMDEDELKTCMQCLFGLNTGFDCSDIFAIRPENFNSTIAPNQIFTAGTPSSLTFRADRFDAAGTQDYNETEDTSFVVDVNISNPAKICQDMNISFSPSINFTNGTVTDNYTLSNVGDFNVTMHEIVGAEFAKVDENDTSPVDRLITPYTQQIKVIPHHFGIVGGLENGSNGFTYLSNFEQNPNDADRNISASLDINVTAQAESNATTSNYTAECYANDGNVTLALANSINPDPAGSLTKLLWYHYTPDANGSVPLNTMALQYDIPFSSTQFDSNDTNGTAEFSYKINFDRNVTKVVNPFVVTVADINATDDDGVAGNNPLDSNATFVYGRVIARDVRIFGQKPFIANAWYEAFSQTPLTIGATALAPSRTDTNWYIMAPHVDTTDGDANVTYVVTSSSTTTPNIGGASAAGVEIYNFAAQTPPYSAKAHINTEAWLWYGINALDYADPSGANLDCFTHPCFNINVVPAVGATGSAKQDAADSKANKRTGGETGGTWKSTSDYAPAVR